MSKVVESHVRGGLDLLDRADRTLDPDEAEKIERDNKRIADPLDAVLAQLTGKSPGGRINQYMIDFEVPGSRNEQVEFDRYYFDLNLIVDMMQLPLNEYDRDSNEARIKNHRMHAARLNHRYLAIEGSATAEQIAFALQ